MLWAFIESFGYKIIYLILHVHFFNKLSPTLYSLQATLFAVVYTGLTIVNRGFDQALLYHFNQAVASSSGIKTIIKNTIQHTLITIVLVALGILCIRYFDLIAQNNNIFISVLGTLLIVETIKKNIKVLLYLTFHNTYVTIAEIIGLGIYTYCIIQYLSYNTTIISPLFSYLLCINSIVVVTFIGLLYNYYRKQPSDDNQTSYRYNTTLQYQSYGLQLAKLLVSSEFLMPFYAISMQLHNSAHFFIISTIIQSGEFILYKLCYISGSTFFAYNSLQDTFLSNHMRSILLNRLLPFYSFVVIFSWIPIFFILPLTTSNLYFTILYGATLLINNFLMLYEKYAIIHNRMRTYLCYSLVLCASTWSLLYLLQITYHIFIAGTFFFIGKIMLGLFVYNQGNISEKQGA